MAHHNRREFLRKSSGAALGLIAGAHLINSSGLIPVDDIRDFWGKEEMK